MSIYLLYYDHKTMPQIQASNREGKTQLQTPDDAQPKKRRIRWVKPFVKHHWLIRRQQPTPIGQTAICEQSGGQSQTQTTGLTRFIRNMMCLEIGRASCREKV